MSKYIDTIIIETWKEIDSHPGYEISDQGRVRSYWQPPAKGSQKWTIGKESKLLKPGKGSFGYPQISLGKKFHTEIHRLVLLAFVGPCPPGMECCHNDGVPENVCLSNLRWDTPENNHYDKRLHGTGNNGERNGQAKLTVSQVKEIRKLFKSGVSQNALASIYNISQPHVSSIITYKSWFHV